MEQSNNYLWHNLSCNFPHIQLMHAWGKPFCWELKEKQIKEAEGKGDDEEDEEDGGESPWRDWIRNPNVAHPSVTECSKVCGCEAELRFLHVNVIFCPLKAPFSLSYKLSAHFCCAVLNVSVVDSQLRLASACPIHLLTTRLWGTPHAKSVHCSRHIITVRTPTPGW